MADGLDRAADSWVVGSLGRAADLAKAERAKRVALTRIRAVRGLVLRDLQGRGHQGASGAASGSPSSAAASSFEDRPFEVPSTSPTVSPRSSATSSGRRRFSRAVIVAFTRLI